MVPDDRKLKRLIAAASMYYKDNMLPSEIAGVVGISRPMVSRLLAEARECGVVTITINEAGSAQELLAGRVTARFSMKRAFVVLRLHGVHVLRVRRDQDAGPRTPAG